MLSKRASRLRRLASLLGKGMLFLITSASTLAVVFIFYFIIKDAVPFFTQAGFREFFSSTRWYPTREPAEFGALALVVGSGLVTVGAVIFAVVLGVPAAVCLSDILPFKARQFLKPVIEVLAAIPSVVYGFFALVVFALLLQNQGGKALSVSAWIIGTPVAGLSVLVLGDITTGTLSGRCRWIGRTAVTIVLGPLAFSGLFLLGSKLGQLQIVSGTNALNASIILGIMALPTVVSVSEDALWAAGRELREGSYALGTTRAETIIKVVIPAASGGIGAAVILGVMRTIGETMAVWMASGNAAQIPSPWYNLLAPVRTLTATIAADMGEADQVTGSLRYHVLFALALCLLVFSFIGNLASEWVIRRTKKKLG